MLRLINFGVIIKMQQIITARTNNMMYLIFLKKLNLFMLSTNIKFIAVGIPQKKNIKYCADIISIKRKQTNKLHTVKPRKINKKEIILDIFCLS